MLIETKQGQTREKEGKTYLITHSKPPIIRRWPPQKRYKHHVGKVDQIKPTIEDKPARLPMIGHEVRVADTSKGEAVEEEEAENYHDACEDTPPELAVHERLDRLLAIVEVFHRYVEGVERPDVERC